ncbi:MAG TPA: hypothetical protein VGR71_04330 [Nitrospira sp.]|nr:hypothetical protein [Nitrospira sp.]
MEERVKPDETRAWFAEHMNERPDYGLGHAVLNLTLHPQNPFSPNERRKLKAGFLYGVAWIATAIAVFVFFNFALGRF